MDRQLFDDVPDEKYDKDNDDEEDVDLVVLVWIGSCLGMTSRMREREVEGTVWTLQSIHWS